MFKDLADKVCGTILNIEMGIPEQNVANVKKPFVAKGNQEENYQYKCRRKYKVNFDFTSSLW